MNISDEAVEALANVLANEALFDADIAGSGWNAETDSSDHFLPRARIRAKEYLEAAAPHLMSRAFEEAANKFQSRSETFLATMQNMVGLPEYTNDDIIRYGAYSAEARVTAIRLRSSADSYRSAGAGE